MKVHALWAALFLGALVAFGLAMRHAGAAAERSNRLRDSLIVAQAKIDSAQTAALRQHQADSLAAYDSLQALGRRTKAAEALAGSVGPLLAKVRSQADSSQQEAITALEAAHSAREGILVDSLHTYKNLYFTAQAGYDSLAALTQAQQVQLHGLQDALVAARRVPIWNATAVRVVELALAVKGVASIFGH